ncbi:HD domain-containing protein [Vibrio sp. T187]|uniref:HD-GYP domain-containing protein n=1 Tax=Vibrio TaxID=662 RepID=UPI0010C95759|nr:MULTISPECIES: HD domain-containing phosphohydrolase [Vibrio]MBW3695860.1 HD domain-containing protein [Vibrio sp. T187]
MTSYSEDVTVDLRRALFGIAKALDNIGVETKNHGQRVGYIAYQCALSVGWEEEQAQLAFYLGLIHDCGVTQGDELVNLMSDMVPTGTQNHCLKGYQILKECPALSIFSKPVLYHHTPWSELKDLPVSSLEKELAAIVMLADRVDYLYGETASDRFGNLSNQSKAYIISCLTVSAGTLFESNLVQHMCELVDNDDFWFSMDISYIDIMSSKLAPIPFFSQHMSLDETIAFGEFIAKVVDAKSSFTFQHSLKVGQLSEYLAKQLGYSYTTQRKLYLAGLVHDIGKLQTPSDVLHKPGALTDEEYCCIKKHATDTRFSLQELFLSDQICDWASNHHERLDGSGYPMGKTAEQLDQPSRIIAVVDVFQALTQYRPYREGMSLEQAISILEELVEDNKLDTEVFNCLRKNAQYCFELSTESLSLEEADKN